MITEALARQVLAHTLKVASSMTTRSDNFSFDSNSFYQEEGDAEAIAVQDYGGRVEIAASGHWRSSRAMYLSDGDCIRDTLLERCHFRIVLSTEVFTDAELNNDNIGLLYLANTIAGHGSQYWQIIRGQYPGSPLNSGRSIKVDIALHAVLEAYPYWQWRA